MHPSYVNRPRTNLGCRDVREVPVVIYALCEPATGEVRYIGRTQNLRARLSQHLSGASSELLTEWIRQLPKGGPVVHILHVLAPGEDADPWEVKFIREHDSPRLLNARGGKGEAARARRERERERAFAAWQAKLQAERKLAHIGEGI